MEKGREDVITDAQKAILLKASARGVPLTPEDERLLREWECTHPAPVNSLFMDGLGEYDGVVLTRG